jgi:cysteine desulfurase family protein (TIGR01976 family)
MIASTRESVAAFLNARGADEIAFGLNATSFMRAISLAVGQTLNTGSGGRHEVVVSELDHEANIATWLALERSGARIVWWRSGGDGRLHVEDLAQLVGERTRIVACTMASNATGSLVDAAAAAGIARAAGAEVFLDAVHYAPHGPIDVQALGCDYLVCSGYKMFAPHMGFAWCRREAINALPTFREDFIPDVTPDKLEAGTYVYENIAGLRAAIAYLEELGVSKASDAGGEPDPPRPITLHRAMSRIAEYERTLSYDLLTQLGDVPGVQVHGVVDPSRLAERVPTLAFTVAGIPAARVAESLAARDFGVRSGHMYSPRLISHLGLPGGVVRASLVHYNTAEEIGRFRTALTAVIHDLR